MVDKKDSFDEEFDFDEDFPSFDDFDEDEADSGGAFDFTDSSDEPEAEAIASTESDDTYQFEETAETAETAEPGAFEEISEEPKQSILDQALAFINQLRQKDAKKFYTYAGASFFVLIMIVFFILKSFSSAPVTTKTATKSKATTTAGQKTVSPEQFTDLSGAQTVSSQPQTQPQTLAAPVVNAPVVSTHDDSDTTKMLTTLQQQNQQLTQQIQTLQAQLTQATSSYSDLQQQIHTNQTRVTNIEKTVNNVESQMSKVSNALQTIVSATTGGGSSTMPTQASQPPSREGPRTVYQAPPSSAQGNSYFIQAIIPGRAWLQDSSGQTITVTYGDAVPGLGKVTKIDPENGMVVTSAGVNIMYGINEG